MSAVTPATQPDGSQQPVVEAALMLLERMGLSPADLVAAPRKQKAMPTFADEASFVHGAPPCGRQPPHSLAARVRRPGPARVAGPGSRSRVTVLSGATCLRVGPAGRGPRWRQFACRGYEGAEGRDDRLVFFRR
jgi:hypothetical protein